MDNLNIRIISSFNMTSPIVTTYDMDMYRKKISTVIQMKTPVHINKIVSQPFTSKSRRN